MKIFEVRFGKLRPERQTGCQFVTAFCEDDVWDALFDRMTYANDSILSITELGETNETT